MICGGFGNVKEATAEVQSIVEIVKGEVEQKLNQTFTKFQALAFTSQVVAGVNYLVKVETDRGYLHVKIFKPLPHTGAAPSLSALQHEGLTQESPLNPIENNWVMNNGIDIDVIDDFVFDDDW